MEESNLTPFAGRLRTLVGEGSVAEFARKCELGDSLVRKYLEGAEPGLDKVLQVWRATGCSLLWLAAGEGDPAEADTPMAAMELAQYHVDRSEFVSIPHYDQKASAGLGTENGDSAPHKRNHFRQEWWTRNVGVSPENCFSMEITGDSMAPRLTESHIPIVERMDEMRGDAVYVFRLDGEVFIKQLEKIPGRGIIAKSQNENYSPWEIGDGTTFGEFKIIGRVIRKQLIELP